MSNLNWTVSYTGTPDPKDIAGAKHVIENENAKRLADVDQHGDPKLPPLPTTGAGLKTSRLLIADAQQTRIHERSITQAADKVQTNENVKERWRWATPAQQAAILDILPTTQA